MSLTIGMAKVSSIWSYATNSASYLRNIRSWQQIRSKPLSNLRVLQSQLSCVVRAACFWMRKKRYFGSILLLLLLLGVWLISPVLQRIQLSRDQSWYELGWFGIAPVRYYKSFSLPVTHLKFLQQDSRCTQQNIFLAPRGPNVESPGGMILDSNGELIWRQPTLEGDTQDLRPQQYHGKTVLTLWSGREADGRKQGAWYMFDEEYNLVHEVLPSGHYFQGDMHEFAITADNTALLTLYHPIEADLSSIGGPKSGWLLENIFQEINVETREVLFEWNATKYFDVSDTSKEIQGCHNDPTSAFGGCGRNRNTAFDFYHINSVAKDERGNYLISGRNLHMLSYVNGTSGDVIWNLGGLYNEFEDLSGGAATNFSWQHHARWRYNMSSISLFDNSNHKYADPDIESRGMIIDIDVNARTAYLRHQYYHPERMRSLSQGDVQVFEDTGNVLVGWGRNPSFTEFSEEGTVLCDARFGATAFSSFGSVTSYRVFRGDWSGFPHCRIDVVIDGLDMYVSWNGDTEVHKWQAEVAKVEEGEYEVVRQVFRAGFETKLPLPSSKKYEFFRAVGLSKNGTVLGTSKPLTGNISRPLLSPLLISTLASASGTLGLLLVLYMSSRALIRWKRRRPTSSEGYWSLAGFDNSQTTDDFIQG